MFDLVTTIITDYDASSARPVRADKSIREHSVDSDRSRS